MGGARGCKWATMPKDYNHNVSKAFRSKLEAMEATQGRYFKKLRFFTTFHGLPDAEVDHVEVLGHLGHPGHAIGQPSLHLGREPHQKVLIHDLGVSQDS